MFQNPSRWLFTNEQIKNSPSFKDGLDQQTELSYRQFTAVFIHDLGYKLKAPQICINTAIIFMHRFYMIHSFKKFHRIIVASACLFFACKVEEHPRPLRQIIDGVQQLLRRSAQPLDPDTEEYKKHSEEIVSHESCLIQTLGFNVLIKHAHAVIIKTIQMIKAPRELAQTAYVIANNSLKITNFCIRFSYDKIACFCIYLACKWTGLRIPTSNEGREWFEYVNQEVTVEQLEDITEEYLLLFDKCSPDLKKKLASSESKVQDDDKKAHVHSSHANNVPNTNRTETPQNPPAVNGHHPQHPSQQQKDTRTTTPPATTLKSQPVTKTPQSNLKPSISSTNLSQSVNKPINDQQQQLQQQVNIKKSLTTSDLNKITKQQPPIAQQQTTNTMKQEPRIKTESPSDHQSFKQQTIKSEPRIKSELNDSITNHDYKQQRQHTPTSQTSTTQQMKRAHEDLNNSVPNKMPKYIIEKSVS